MPLLTANFSHVQWRRHGVDWGGHVHPSFPRVRFSNFSRSVEKTLGGLIFTHSEHSFPSLRTFISLIHSLIYSKFSGSLPHAGNSSILLRAHSKVKIINTNLRASMSDERLNISLKLELKEILQIRLNWTAYLNYLKPVEVGNLLCKLK